MISNYSNPDKLEFRGIILSHIKKILELSSHELKESERVVFNGNISQTIEKEDTRYSYIQAIENLAYVLLPHFDKDMQTSYDECVKVIVSFRHELISDFKNDYDKVLSDKKSPDDNKFKDEFVASIKIKYAKKLFCDLNLLLKRKDYLKSSVYGESSGESDNDIVEDSGDDSDE